MTVLGDTKVGKTNLITSYLDNLFPINYVPTVFDQFYSEVKVHD